MMTEMPGERLVSRHVPGGWKQEDGAQAAATLIAASFHTCRLLLPLSCFEPGTHRFAIALDNGMPGVLEVRVLLGIGRAEVSLRVPAGGDEAGCDLIDRVCEQALAMAPEKSPEEQPAIAAVDDLPF